MSVSLYRPRSDNRELAAVNRRRTKASLRRWVKAHVRTDYREFLGFRR